MADTTPPDQKAKSPSTRSAPPRKKTSTAVKKESGFLQFEKLRVAEAYFSSLQATNQKSLQYFQDTIQHTYYAFYAGVILYVLTYIVTLAALITGLVLMFEPTGSRQIWAAGCLIGSAIMLVILINKDPIRSSRHLINNLARLNIVFTGYIRQIHQVDATFRGMFLSSKEYGVNDMEDMLLRIQESVDNALDGINQILEDLNE